MKMKLFGLALILSPLLTQATEKPYLFDFIENPVAGKAYRSLIARHNLPEWVQGGGTSTPANEVEFNGVKYWAMSGCKPHNCPFQSIAVLYSPVKGDIHGVFSEYDFENDKQRLVWLNLDSIGSDSMRRVLFARLLGDVE